MPRLANTFLHSLHILDPPYLSILAPINPYPANVKNMTSF
jgi:hypothetical protein